VALTSDVPIETWKNLRAIWAIKSIARTQWWDNWLNKKVNNAPVISQKDSNSCWELGDSDG
jgi:hypothetical protein